LKYHEMRYSEKIYNKNKNIIATGSEICDFKYPEYTVDGMLSITPEITTSDDNVFIIEQEEDIDVNIVFTTNTDELNENVKYNYSILPYNKQLNAFSTTNAVVSPLYDYVGNSNTDAVNTSELPGEGEYILKVAYQYPACTLIASLLNKTYVANTFNNSLPYGNYDKDRDKYFVMLYKADEPRLDVGVSSGSEGEENVVNSDKLIMRTLAVESGVSTYTIGIDTEGDVIITLNGMILSKNNDYSLDGNILTFFDKLDVNDIVNYIVIGKTNSSGLKTEEISVVTPIYEGATNEEGLNKYYRNTDTGKYEIYTNYRIKNTESVMVTIGGIVLSNKIDYYVSSSNPKRIILEGDLINGDEISIVYDSGETLDRSVTEGYLDISWYVTREVVSTNGFFEVEFSSNETFTDIIQTDNTPYVLGQESYTKRVNLDYPYGTILYYRIKNVKKYLTVSGVELETENYSDAIRIEIKTNVSNNY
jgi:hypothetical protein